MCTCTWCLYSNSGGACRPLCSNQLTSAPVHFHTWASRDIKQSGDIFQSLWSHQGEVSVTEKSLSTTGSSDVKIVNESSLSSQWPRWRLRKGSQWRPPPLKVHLLAAGGGRARRAWGHCRRQGTPWGQGGRRTWPPLWQEDSCQCCRMILDPMWTPRIRWKMEGPAPKTFNNPHKHLNELLTKPEGVRNKKMFSTIKTKKVSWLIVCGSVCNAKLPLYEAINRITRTTAGDTQGKISSHTIRRSKQMLKKIGKMLTY